MLSREPEEGARPGVQAEEALVKGAQRFWDPCSKAYIDPSGILGGLAHRNYMLLRATGRRKSSKVNQTLKPESMGISVESVEWVLVINTYWASVGAGFWLATKKVSSWGAQTLTSSQDLYLPYFWSDHSLLPTWSFWVGGTAKAAGWSTPARPIERHGALSRHIPCAVTSCISCSDLHLPTVLAAATMEVFFFPGWVGVWGDGGEMLKPSSWPSDSWGRVHWGNCSYNLTGWWPVFHQSFLSSHCQRWDTSYIQKDGQKATALQLTFSGKYYIYHKIIDFHL